MTGRSHPVQPRFALVSLLAVCVALGSTGCATASRATLTPSPASEPVAEAPPAPAPEQPASAPVAKAEKPKAVKRAAPRPTAEVKAEPKTESKTLVSARTPEPRRPQPDGVSAALGPTEPVPFEPAGMTRPQKVSGREPQLTPEARAERVRGTALVRCVVTRDGRVTNCRLLNGLPHMEQELLEALSTWRVTPVTSQGRPLDVDYTFVVRITG
jgi:protein TonB